MRRPAIFQRRAEQDVKMTPMIDVVFLLLIFFLWTSSFQLAEQMLPSQLSLAEAGQLVEAPPPEADFEDVVVRIGWDGSRPAWQLNDRPVASMRELRQQLDQIAGIKRDVPVIVHPDPPVPLGEVINVYDACRLSGFDDVRFAAAEGN